MAVVKGGVMRNHRVLVAVVLILLMIVPMLAGCGGGAKDESVKVAVLYVGDMEENGWSYQGHIGAQAMAGVLQYVQLSETDNVSAGDAVAVMSEYADEGYDIIFCHSYDYGAAIGEVAPDYPDVIFMWCTGDNAMYDNVGIYDGRIYEPRYLAGMTAGNMTESDKIGFVAAVPLAQVIMGINAFARGVAVENPDAEVYVEWTNVWYNLGLEEGLAQSLVDDGCDVIVNHTDSCVLGQVADENGVYYMSLSADCGQEAPLSFLTAAYYDWEPVMTDVVKAVHDGMWEQRPGHDWWYSMEQGGVRLSLLSDLAPEALGIRIDEKGKEIESGGLEVFPNMIDSELRNMNYLEPNVVGQIPQQPVEDSE